MPPKAMEGLIRILIMQQHAESTAPSALYTAPTTMNSSTKKMFDQDNTSKPAGDRANPVSERAIVLFDLNAENLGTQDQLD